MPVIQQERGVKSVKGLPLRWGKRAYRELRQALDAHGEHSDQYRVLAQLLDSATSAPFPLDATDASLCVLAERCADECAELARWVHDAGRLRAGMAEVCARRGIQAPAMDDDGQAVARCCDPAWWRGRLRKVHGRAAEALAIRLGFVSVRAGAYASDETVKRRVAQVARNKAALAAVQIENEEGLRMTLEQAASKGTSNKRIRRGELMLRLAGCEDISRDLGHVALFVTVTAPSRYHAVLQKSGEVNPRYAGADPRRSQAFHRQNWVRARAEYGRHGIAPYGFRIAEPHHDGCVHWHMLLFMPAYKVRRFQQIVKKHWLREDGDEPGAQARRVTFERIDPAKGGAAAYLAKYISKNIDDDSDDAHDELLGPDGEPIKLAIDKAKRASERVDAWAGVWGIRQFQPIGQPPVTVWRELRRVDQGEVREASLRVRAAWDACQRVERTDTDTGEVTVERPANFGNYIRAQGGVCRGRDYAIGMAHKEGRIEGRYGPYTGALPLGVVDRADERVYQSVRHQWQRVAVGGSPSWSPVNKCTQRGGAERAAYVLADEGPQLPVWWTSNFELVTPESAAWFDRVDEQVEPDPVINPWDGAKFDPVEYLGLLERGAQAFGGGYVDSQIQWTLERTGL